MRVSLRVKRIVMEYDVVPVEILLALHTIIWGASLIAPYQTFASTSAYYLLGLLAREEVWGCGAVWLGALHLGNVLLTSPLRWLRQITITIIGAFWVGVVLAIAVAQGMIFPGVWLFSVNAIAALWVQWRLGGYRS